MKISVIIPVYNAETFLKKAVESALQFDEVTEVILAEDASSDSSLILCRKLEHEYERVMLFQHEDRRNHGAAETRNLGIRKSGSEFIAFLDADDYYLPNRFDVEKILLDDEKIEGVFGALGTEFITDKGKIEFQEKFKNNRLTTVQYQAEGIDIFEGLLGLSTKTFGSFFHLNTLTVRRDSLLKKNLLFNKDLRVHQDSDFIIKLAYHCYLKTGIIDKPVAIRGVHDDNRITKIKQYSPKFYANQFQFYNSLYLWANANNLDKKYLQKIKLDFISFKIANKRGAGKYLFYVISALQNPELLKTRYRFHALNPQKQ
ncbi:glycosyltransferase family 2 protein [Chryseobacterium sp. Leaf394]|uniref:glycosyltransferase family 2 protein n=1 Tax=Chryseobacterium sp. Leaf394 TaxID=1736361 RepID=UPI0006F391AD|nr:glycosyltransferase family 2 protein [Chryseobacterium sp. Leaf394]KQS95228.1 capsular biosynthesis protein CpsI [Chryseobacterium sp. Leaf394]